MKKGPLLFTIEPEPYRLKLEQAKAAEAGAEASLKQAKAAFERQSELVQRHDDSSELRFGAGGDVRAQAKVAQAKANTQLAQINSTTRRSRRRSTASSRRARCRSARCWWHRHADRLATIVQLDPIYVNFNVSEQDVLRIRARHGGARHHAWRI